MNDFMMYDVTAILIFATLIVSNIEKNKIKGRTNFLYTAVLVVCVITLVFRLTYQLILRHCAYAPASVLVAKSFIYLALIAHSFIYPVGIVFIFSSLGILPLINKNQVLKISIFLLSLIPVVYILMDIYSNTLFIIDENMKMIVQNPMHIIDVCIVLILLFGYGLAIYYHRFLERTHLINAMLLFPLNISLFIVQAMLPNAQLEMFVLAITAYLVFSTIQRPELLINPDTLAQSAIAFENEFKKLMNIQGSSKIILIKIVNHRSINMYIGNDRLLAVLKKVTLFLRNLSKTEKLNATVYYLNEYIYALPTEELSDEMVENVLNQLEKYFSQNFIMDSVKIKLETRFLIVSTPQDVSNYDFLSYIVRAFFRIVEGNGKPQWYRDYAQDRNFIIKNNIDRILTRAIEEKKFQVYYQPIYNVSKKKYCSAEALVRLNDPEFGNIPPGMFLDYAERTNQIHLIGDFVIEKVCEFLGSSKAVELGLDYVEVNLSAAQCVETDIVEKIKGWLEKYNIKPEQLRLEITEIAASFNSQVVEKNIYALKELGIHFALDDYGTGYSNIKKVISLPFDLVKLNKSFVNEIDNPYMLSIVQDTIRMLKKLGKEILIEGIETSEHAEQFSQLMGENSDGCEYLQGFYFSHPLPQSEFVKFLTM